MRVWRKVFSVPVRLQSHPPCSIYTLLNQWQIHSFSKHDDISMTSIPCWNVHESFSAGIFSQFTVAIFFELRERRVRKWRRKMQIMNDIYFYDDQWKWIQNNPLIANMKISSFLMFTDFVLFRARSEREMKWGENDSKWTMRTTIATYLEYVCACN